MSHKISIRPLDSSDEAFLWEMLYHAIFTPPGQPLPPREVLREPELRRYVEAWGRPGDVGWLASADGIPVGAVWLRVLTGDNRGYGFVDDTTPELSIALLPEYRGEGIGTQLLGKLLETPSLPFSAISLSVDSDNPARRLYQRFGFQDVEISGSSVTMLLRLLA